MYTRQCSIGCVWVADAGADAAVSAASDDAVDPETSDPDVEDKAGKEEG